MKLTVLLALAACLHLHVNARAQITITETNVPLVKVFKQIEQQTGYSFWYNSSILEKTTPVTLRVSNATLDEVMMACLSGQPLTYSVIEKVIVLKAVVKKEPLIVPPAEIRGRITNEKGEPVAGATVMDKASRKATATDSDGQFLLAGIEKQSVLIITSIGYEPLEWKATAAVSQAIVLKVSVNTLDESVVIAYGSTTKRLNTGSVVKVSSEEIERQPVSNPLAALMGRVPGLEITQTSGVPGSAFNIRIRGQSSIGAGPNSSFKVSNDPLIIIDGTPFVANNTSANELNNATNKPRDAGEAGLSPLSFINPSDIQSVEILKDADATAIYGSRGANGVILITTKKGVGGDTKISLNSYFGFSKVTALPKLLNTSEYVEMRKEAFKNDGVTPTISNASDILVYDTTKYTDLQKILVGHTSVAQDVQLSVSGGTERTNFLIGSGFHRETVVFYSEPPSSRGSLHFNINHSSINRRLSITLNGAYSTNESKLPNRDLNLYSILATPDLPELLLDNGQLNWSYNGTYFSNPLAYTLYKYSSQVDNLISDLNISYSILPGLTIKSSFGFNSLLSNENVKTPKAAISPAFATKASSGFALTTTRSWIAEPQIQFRKKISDGDLSILVGSTLQQTATKLSTVTGSNYSSDLLLGSISGAGNITSSDNSSQYKYLATFTRVNYNWREKYLFNLTGRRDGSTRFGPGHQYADFGAVGLGWIFSNERFFNKIKWIEFAKLRTSYGITGNDQIGNYNYLDAWSPISGIYQTPGIKPTRLYNPDFAWERNAKFEIALENAFFNGRIYTSFGYYNNRTGNQLILYSLPSQTGFTVVIKNFPALIENSGFEFSAKSTIIKRNDFTWEVSGNLSVPENKLLSFPDIEKTSYASDLEVGQSLSVARAYHSLGLNSQTGIFELEDLNHDGQLSNLDLYSAGTLGTKFYGGLENEFHYKNIDFAFTIQFTKQTGRGYAAQIASEFPGQAYNFSNVILDRWQKPGDVARFQRFTMSNSDVFLAGARYGFSDDVLEDMSFARLKNLSISFQFPKRMTQQLKLKNARAFIQAQNALTVSKVKEFDPETKNILTTPPLKTLVLGLHIDL